MFHPPCRARSLAFAVFALVVMCSLPAWGQDRASVQGTVTDSSGAAIAGARVTVRNPATGARQMTVTGRSGFYAVIALPPGAYVVTARAPHFTPRSVPGVVISGEQAKRVNFQLAPGTLHQEVSVSAAPPALQTNSA